MSDNWMLAAIHTWEASRWTLLLARVFGKRIEAHDPPGTTVVGYRWRGVLYLTDYRFVP